MSNRRHAYNPYSSNQNSTDAALTMEDSHSKPSEDTPIHRNPNRTPAALRMKTHPPHSPSNLITFDEEDNSLDELNIIDMYAHAEEPETITASSATPHITSNDEHHRASDATSTTQFYYSNTTTTNEVNESVVPGSQERLESFLDDTFDLDFNTEEFRRFTVLEERRNEVDMDEIRAKIRHHLAEKYPGIDSDSDKYPGLDSDSDEEDENMVTTLEAENEEGGGSQNRSLRSAAPGHVQSDEEDDRGVTPRAVHAHPEYTPNHSLLMFPRPQLSRPEFLDRSSPAEPSTEYLMSPLAVPFPTSSPAVPFPAYEDPYLDSDSHVEEQYHQLQDGFYQSDEDNEGLYGSEDGYDEEGDEENEEDDTARPIFRFTTHLALSSSMEFQRNTEALESTRRHTQADEESQGDGPAHSSNTDGHPDSSFYYDDGTLLPGQTEEDYPDLDDGQGGSQRSIHTVGHCDDQVQNPTAARRLSTPTLSSPQHPPPLPPRRPAEMGEDSHLPYNNLTLGPNVMVRRGKRNSVSRRLFEEPAEDEDDQLRQMMEDQIRNLSQAMRQSEAPVAAADVVLRQTEETRLRKMAKDMEDFMTLREESRQIKLAQDELRKLAETRDERMKQKEVMDSVASLPRQQPSAAAKHLEATSAEGENHGNDKAPGAVEASRAAKAPAFGMKNFFKKMKLKFKGKKAVAAESNEATESVPDQGVASANPSNQQDTSSNVQHPPARSQTNAEDPSIPSFHVSSFEAGMAFGMAQAGSSAVLAVPRVDSPSNARFNSAPSRAPRDYGSVRSTRGVEMQQDSQSHEDVLRERGLISSFPGSRPSASGSAGQKFVIKGTGNKKHLSMVAEKRTRGGQRAQLGPSTEDSYYQGEEEEYDYGDEYDDGEEADDLEESRNAPHPPRWDSMRDRT